MKLAHATRTKIGKYGMYIGKYGIYQTCRGLSTGLCFSRTNNPNTKIYLSPRSEGWVLIDFKISEKKNTKNLSITGRHKANTLIMSMGWMTHVVSIPKAPPLKNGFTVFHTFPVLGFSPAISLKDLKTRPIWYCSPSSSWDLMVRKNPREVSVCTLLSKKEEE